MYSDNSVIKLIQDIIAKYLHNIFVFIIIRTKSALIVRTIVLGSIVNVQ